MEAEQSPICAFADDIGGLAGEAEELTNLVERLDEISSSYGMEISAEKTNLMTSITSGINNEIKINGQMLETVTSFKYLGLVAYGEGSKAEILSRIANMTAALTRLKPFESTGAFLSVPTYNSCNPLPHPSYCILVDHGPSQQSFKEEHEPWK